MIADPLRFAEYILGTVELRGILLKKKEIEKERARKGNDENLNAKISAVFKLVKIKSSRDHEKNSEKICIRIIPPKLCSFPPDLSLFLPLFLNVRSLPKPPLYNL